MPRNFREMREPDYPLCAISLDTTLLNKTGTWRIFRPVYENKLPPCNDACPAKADIQKYISLALEKRYEEAYRTILEKNPFPAITGRVCFHPCEDSCNRREYDEPLGIHNIERFLGDYGLNKAKGERRKKLPDTKRVAIIGSGPAGLTCAYYLAREGIQVEVFEKERLPGGLLRTGIPAYRLPKDVLDEEIKKLERLGVKFTTNANFPKDISLPSLLERFSATFLAIGAQKERGLGIPGEEGEGVLEGISFLRRVNLGKRPPLGKRVLVIGGGNTAVDCARAAKRLGKDVTILYRRTRQEMPAFPKEVEEAEKEGVKIEFLVAPVKVFRTRRKEVKGLECIKMRLGAPDTSGRRRPIPIKGSNFSVPADTVIKAIGELVELEIVPEELEKTEWGIKADHWGNTNLRNVLAGGDCVTGPRTVAEAIAAGRRAAEKILYDLKVKEKLPPEDGREPVKFAQLNPFYFENAPRVKMPQIEGRERRTFKEINLGLKEEELLAEASRCFSCGVCNHCDNCYVFCPDLSVKKLEDGYEFNYDYCKGCGVCAQECPRSSITMYLEGEL